MEELPAGTVTFLFTDIEGSTRLLQERPEHYGEMLGAHRALLRHAFATHGGREIGTQGDSFFVAFGRARDAVAAAIESQRALARQAWPDGARLRVRMGIHTGEPTLGSEGYIGLGVHRAARICSVGHGGQILLSDATRQLIEDELPSGCELKDLGVHRLKDLDRPEHLFQALASIGVREPAPQRVARVIHPSADDGHRRTGRPPADDQPPGRATARMWRRRAPLALFAAAGLLGAVAVVLVFRHGGVSQSRTPALNLAKDSVAGLGGADHRPEVAVPLPGRPTGMASAEGRVFVTTVDSAALTVVDGRTRSIVRTVPLRLQPAAVAVAGDRVFVLDPRGTVEGFRTGYDRPTVRITYRRRPETSASAVPRSASLAAAGGVLWATDGSPSLRRIDPRSGRVSSLRAGRSLDGVAIGDGAVWAFSGRTASVVRVDTRRDVVTDVIPIVTRSGSDAPFPIGIATTPGTVWVLNGNTATVTRIDADQRGVIATVPIGMDRAPRRIAASGHTVWIANADGSLTRLEPGRRDPTSLWVGESLSNVSAEGASVWVTTTALDQQLPGGRG
jgi:class 3 adenylate cyclase